MRKIFIILFSFVVCAVYAQPNTVNVGTTGNDGTGDPARTAFQKLNANDVAAFDSIEAHLDRIETVEAETDLNTDSVNIAMDSLRVHNTRLLSLEEWPTDKVKSSTSCTYNDTTDITIGSTASDLAFIIHYVSERNTGGYFQVESGLINVVYNADNGNVYIYSEYVGVDNGLDLEADVSGTSIRINVIVDNTIAANASFDYKIISKFTQ